MTGCQAEPWADNRTLCSEKIPFKSSRQAILSMKEHLARCFCAFAQTNVDDVPLLCKSSTLLASILRKLLYTSSLVVPPVGTEERDHHYDPHINYLNPEEPTFLGFLTMLSLYKILKKGGLFKILNPKQTGPKLSSTPF